MTFEYTDATGERVYFRPAVVNAHNPTEAVAMETETGRPVYFAVDQLEDVIAGMRDVRRQAAGQPAAAAPSCTCIHPPEEDAGQLLHASYCPAAVEETHIVADDSDDPEHVDDCPGCEAFSLPGHVAAGQPDTQQQTEGTVIQAPTPQLSYRLEHRGEGESEWRKGRPGLGVHWTSVDRAKVRQRLAEARAQWPQYEHRMVTITTTVAETVTDEAAR